MDIPESYKIPVMKRYALLKQRALNNIRNLAGDKWTDFNLHDPGITILENLCASIIDLEYRSNFDIADILATAPNTISNEYTKSIFNAKEILPSNPWSINDFRKIVADVLGVYNVRIITSDPKSEIQGGYKIFIAREDPDIPLSSSNDEILDRVMKKIHNHRNLCEDFFQVSILEHKEFYITADLELKHTISSENAITLIANILFEIQDFLVPYINNHTLSEMLIEKDYSVEEIYSGPLLEHGFIDDEELEKSHIKQSFDTSEVIEIIIKNNEIRNLLSLNIFLGEENTPINFSKISNDEAFKLNVQKCSITLYKNGSPINVNVERIFQVYKDLKMKRSIKNQSLSPEDIAYNTGTYRNLSNYFSIQNDFPLIYGVGIEGAMKNSTNSTKSSVNQMKAFLLIFDQIFANYLFNLENAKLILSINSSKEKNYLAQLPDHVPYLENILKFLSYDKNDNDIEFKTQRELLGIKFDKHKKDLYLNDKSVGCYNYTKKIYELNDANSKQINDAVDFLLSAMSEDFSDAPTNIKIGAKQDDFSKIITAKKKFLINHLSISNNKTKALNLLSPIEAYVGSVNCSGLENRICKSLNITNITNSSLCEKIKELFYITHNVEHQNSNENLYSNSNEDNHYFFSFEGNFPKIRNLAIRFGLDPMNYEIIETDDLEYKIILYVDKLNNKFLKYTGQSKIVDIDTAESIIDSSVKFFQDFNTNSEGFYMIEHILLRTDTKIQNNNDPYSFTVTIALPTWPARFQMQDFKNLLYKTVLENSPAHIFVNILWLDIAEMEIFEKAYKNWTILRTSKETTKEAIRKASQTLLGLILMYGNEDL